MLKQYLSAEFTALPTRGDMKLRLATCLRSDSMSGSSGALKPSKDTWSRITSTHL